ncbi:hypothetical protein GIB64_04710 [Pseudomonas lactis]|uniref:hypothetical protein n=1 Tax=Pseudomonas TaxID=286 RepID=UPI000BB66832|nr:MULTISPECIES: hypothetical protein [Pseudomonas]MBA5956723.1 hypothetical protein [Pseudomonas lactis]PRW80474.1 hypothetical protein C7A12_04615 [Pseudomonas fluorescens]PRW81710.1 hypothetical protein C7A13_05740 [Pseudomonas fluorescens]
MSVKKVKLALVDFVKGEKDRAIVLKGDWGTGKTHLWKQVVLESRDSFHKRNYSYVSLFGLNSLKDLKKSIYENKVYRERAHIASDESSFEENLKDISGRFAGWMRKGSSLFNDVSAMGVKGIGPIVESLQFLRVTDTLVCLDDFERKGSGLHDREVLGLISLLIESKNCRVVMLLNDGTLKSGDDFFSYHEKVFDYEVTFNPSVEESVKLVFSTNSKLHEILTKNVTRLDINNIRLLKKIDYFAGLLKKTLDGANDHVIEQALHVLPLAILSKYGGDAAKVDLDFILNYGEGYIDTDLPGDEVDEVEAKLKKSIEEKTNYLEDYGFTRCDEFDVAIIDLVKKGYADEESLKEVIKALEAKIKHDSEIALLQDAWNIYHASFLDNDDKVFEAFDLAIEKSLVNFEVSNLDAVACVYTEAGRADKIKPVIDKYFDTIIVAKNIQKKSDVFRWPEHDYVQQKLDEYFDGLVVEKSLAELIEHAYKVSGFNSTDVRNSAAKKTEAEYYDYFSSLDDYNLTHYVRMCLKCGQVSSPEQHIQNSYSEIFVKTYRCLMKLSEVSLLNKSRMGKFKGYEKLFAQAEEELRLQQDQTE